MHCKHVSAFFYCKHVVGAFIGKISGATTILSRRPIHANNSTFQIYHRPRLALWYLREERDGRQGLVAHSGAATTPRYVILSLCLCITSVLDRTSMGRERGYSSLFG